MDVIHIMGRYVKPFEDVEEKDKVKIEEKMVEKDELKVLVKGELLGDNDFVWNMYRNISSIKVCIIYIYIYIYVYTYIYTLYTYMCVLIFE